MIARLRTAWLWRARKEDWITRVSLEERVRWYRVRVVWRGAMCCVGASRVRRHRGVTHEHRSAFASRNNSRSGRGDTTRPPSTHLTALLPRANTCGRPENATADPARDARAEDALADEPDTDRHDTVAIVLPTEHDITNVRVFPTARAANNTPDVRKQSQKEIVRVTDSPRQSEAPVHVFSQDPYSTIG